MKKIAAMALTSVVCAAGATGALAAPTTVETVEPEPCVVNLAATYPVAPNGFLFTVLPDEGVITCPPGVTVNTSSAINALLQNSATGAFGPAFQYSTWQYFDAPSNSIVQNKGWTLQGGTGLARLLDLLYGSGNVKSTPQGVFDTLSSPTNIPALMEDSVTDKLYRLVLARPVQFVATTAADTPCTVNLKAKYSWKWNQANYWVIPDSAVQCRGVVFSSAAYSVWIEFNSRQENQGVLYTASRNVYDPATKTYTKRFELRLANNGAALANVRTQGTGAVGLLFGLPIPSPTPGGVSQGATFPATPVWGKFSLGTSSSPEINRDSLVWQRGLPGTQYMQVNLSRSSFAIKRATTVSLTARRAGPGKVRLRIRADRNASFQNAIGPTYRRQTVLPNTPADHAVLRRGTTVLKKVKLSPYGTASVTIPDRPGRTPYSVTMVETNDNFTGTARVVA